MNKLDFQDRALRALIIVAGCVSAILLTLQGHGMAVPALAVGATLGALMMEQSGASEE